MSRSKLKLAALPIVIASVVVGASAGVITGSGSAASAVAPTNTSPPSISGTTQVGKTLTATRGSGSRCFT